MKLCRSIVLGLGFALIPAIGAAQLTEDHVAAAEVALQALIDQGKVPGIDQLSTLRIPDSKSPNAQEYTDNTDRILQDMGVELVPGRVTNHVCEPASPAPNKRTGEMEDRRVCRFDDGRAPVLIQAIEVSDSVAVVPIQIEDIDETPTADCPWFGGQTNYVRLVRTEDGGWKFAEVLQTFWYDGILDCMNEPDPR